MVVRLLVTGLILLLGLPLAWRLLQSPQFRDWWMPAAETRRSITFDNGTVRQPPLPASGAAVDAGPGLKKCRRGDRVIYTDAWCPEGTTPVAIERGTVNVLKPLQPPATPAADPATVPASGPLRSRNVRDVLDVSRQPSLYDQQVERAAGAR